MFNHHGRVFCLPANKSNQLDMILTVVDVLSSEWVYVFSDLRLKSAQCPGMMTTILIEFRFKRTALTRDRYRRI